MIDGVTDTQGYNRYSYVKGNPLTLTDPTGYYSWSDFREDLSEGWESAKNRLFGEGGGVTVSFGTDGFGIQTGQYNPDHNGFWAPMEGMVPEGVAVGAFQTGSGNGSYSIMSRGLGTLNGGGAALYASYSTISYIFGQIYNDSDVDYDTESSRIRGILSNIPNDPRNVYNDAVKASRNNRYVSYLDRATFVDEIKMGFCKTIHSCSSTRYFSSTQEAINFSKENPGWSLIEGEHVKSTGSIFVYRSATAPRMEYFKDDMSEKKRQLGISCACSQLTGIESVIGTLSHEGSHKMNYGHGNTLYYRERRPIEYYRENK